MKLIKLIQNYGFNGLLIYFKIITGSISKINVPGVSHPILLRKGTTDIDVFRQVFIMREYVFDYKVDAKFIIDAGSNIGLSVIFFKSIFPDAKIVCIEPEQSNYAVLLKNVEPYKNVETLQRALSNEEEYVSINSNEIGEWAFQTKKMKSPNDANSIQTVTINSILRNNNGQLIDILKVDIEGFERELFSSGYEEWLPKVKYLIIETHDWMEQGTSNNVLKAVNQYNFSLFISGENLIFANNDLIK